MSKAAISILVFGCYILINAVTLLAKPDLLLGTLGLPPTHEPWLRVFGAVIFVLALYYIQAARQEVTPFFRWTTWGRPLLLVGLIILAVLRLVPPIVIVFGVIDLAGAAWTAVALRSPAV